MATSAKKKAAQKLKDAQKADPAISSEKPKICNCLAAFRPRSQHAITCPLYYD